MGDQARDLCLRLVEDTLERIRADRKRASVRVAELLEVIEERLLDPDLDVDALMRDAGQRDRNVSTRFAAELILSPWAYILEARMELAGRILVASTFQIWRVGVQVGYLTPGSFNRAFKKWSGKSPSQFRKEARTPPAVEPPPVPDELVSREEIRQALAGELTLEQTEALADRLSGFGNLVRSGYRELGPEPAGTKAVESAKARSLWQWIEPLPYEVQQRAVETEAPRYQTLVLFNRLCTVSVEAEDGVRGCKLATLALTCLHAMGDRVGEDYLNVFAYAWAVVGYAQRRVGELEGAARHFNEATRMLQQAGDDAHPVVVAILSLFQATLELERDNREEASKLSDEGNEILNLVVDRLLASQPEDSDPEREE